MNNSDTETKLDAADLDLLEQQMQECADAWRQGDQNELTVELNFPNHLPGRFPDPRVMEW